MTITQSFSKLSAVAAGIAIAFALIAGVFATATPARAASLTAAQVSSIISLLQSFGADAATIANVQASLTGGTPTTPTTPSTGGACPALSRSLQQGSTGADVMALQKFLNATAATQVSVSGAGSPGLESSYFGPATKAAVMKFQTLNNVSSIGIVGPQTRAAIAAVCGGVVTPGTPAGSVMVAAGAQPANAIAPESASRVPFTRFTLTNNSAAVVTVNGVTVQRTGFAANSAFAGVALVDSNNVQYGNSKTLNSNNQATVGDTFTINPGETKTFTVVGNMDSDLDAESGQIASFSVVAINSTASIGGSLPIVGASHTINSTLAIGTATALVSSYDPNSTSVTKSIGDAGVKFAGIRVTNGGSVEAARLWTVRWNQSGSAGASDLANVMTYVDGTAYPVMVSADGKYYTTTFPGGILIDKGLSKDIYVQGDVVGSSVSGRTIQFDIYKNTDVFLTGETYGYGITLTPSGNTASSATDASQFLTSDGTTSGTASTPFFSASKVTVNPGSATSISRATSVNAQNVAVNVPNQVLGGFTTDFRGEAVSVQQMDFYFNYSSLAAASGNVLTGLTLVNENGAVVASGNDGTVVGGTAQKVRFSDTVTFPTGAHTYTLKGKVDADVTNNQTITASTTPSSDWTGVTGQTSGSTVSLSGNGLFTMSPVTVKGPTLAVTLSNTPASASIVSGGTVTFANLQFDASQSGEDIRISKAVFDLSATTGISTCQLLDGSSVVSSGSDAPTTLATDANSFTFNPALVITKGNIKTIALRCNVSSAASGAYTFSLQGADWSSVNATGALSGNSLTTSNGLLAITDGNAGTMTVGSQGTLAVTGDSSAPSYKVAASGSTGVTLNVLRFAATNEDITLKQIALQLSGTSASSTPSDVTSVTLWDGATQVGTATFTGSNRYATSTLTQTVNITAGGYKLITVQGNLASLNSNANVGNNPKAGALVKVDFDGNSSAGTQGQGVSSGATINATGSDTTIAGVRAYKSYPSITYSASSGALANSTGPIMTVNIAANSTGDVSVYKLKFNIATTTAVVTSPTFSGPNGSVGTVSIDGVTGSQILTVTFDSGSNTADRTIAAGTSKTYTFGGTVSGVSTSGASVSLSLKADTEASSATAPGLLSQAADVAAYSIVWSPNSTTTQSLTNNDWTNGYGLPGCFLTSGLGQACFAVTKAQ